MLDEEDKRRIEAEEAYRASLRGSDIKKGMKREAGSLLFRVVGLFVVLLLGMAGCALMGHY